MTDLVGIWNIALRTLGADRLTDPNENVHRRFLCSDNWEAVRDAVLRAHPWNFAMRRAKVAADGPKPEFEWAFQYTLPTDPFCLRAWTINEDPDMPFEVEGRKLLANVSGPLRLKYIARITATGEYDPLFVQAVAARLAHAISRPLQKDKKDRDDLWGEYTAKLAQAQSIDGQEGQQDEIPSDFELSRL